jgi:hypothetical protein
MNWSNITLKKYLQIQDILSVEDEYTVFNLIDVIYDVDSQSLPITKVKKYDISFMCNQIPKAKLKDTYTLNGTTYKSNLDLTKVTAAQFIDYQNYLKETPTKFEKVLSVFIVPEGHTYNDGYDIKQVQRDMLELPFVVVQKISFFFLKQLQVFVQTTLFCLTGELKNLKMEKEKRLLLNESLEKMNLLLSGLSHIV